MAFKGSGVRLPSAPPESREAPLLPAGLRPYSDNVLVLNFHRIEKPTGLEINRLSPARFERVLDEIDSSNWVKVSVTFDDGYASICANALPTLQRRGRGAIVFLITGFVGGFDDWDVRILGRRRPMMTWEQVREWSNAGIEFGSHTRTHPDLTALSDRRLREELVESKREIEDQIGTAVRYLSYPFGRHSARVRQAAREAGYAGAFAMDSTAADEFAIPRVNVHALMSLIELRRLLEKGGSPSWRTRLFASLSAGSATVGNWRRSETKTVPTVGARPVVS